VTVLTQIAPMIPALDVVVAAGAGAAFVAAVALYGRRHDRWSRERRTPR
jgi:hypothetical protein